MSKTERLNIRVSEEQLDLLRRAAEASGQTLSDYVLSRVMADAQDELADQRLFSLSSEAWAEFNARLDRPAEQRPGLENLLATAAPWEDDTPEKPVPAVSPQPASGPAVLVIVDDAAGTEAKLWKVTMSRVGTRGGGRFPSIWRLLSEIEDTEEEGADDGVPCA